MRTRPGTRLRAAAARLLTARTLEWFVDPAIADLQHEHESAQRRGHRWRARCIRAFGEARLVQVISLLCVERAMRAATDWLYRPVRSAPAVAVGTVAFGTLFVVVIVSVLGHIPVRHTPYAPMVAFYLAGWRIAVMVPCGFALGAILGAARSSGSRHGALALLGTAAMLSALSGLLLTAMLPSTLSIHALLTAAIHPRATRAVLFVYASRIAAALAPLVLGLLALALSPSNRVRRTTIALCAWAAYMLWFTWLRDPLVAFVALPAPLLAWLPDILVLVPTSLVAIRRFTSESRSTPADA